MNFSIAKSEALRCLTRVIGSTEKKDSIEILSYVKIDVKDGKATFTTTNLDMQSSDIATVSSSGEFSFVAPIYSMLEIVKKLPESAELRFEIQETDDSKKIKISSNKFTFDISTLPVSDFPIMPSVDFVSSIEIDSTKLANAIKRTQFSICNDEVRYNLNGIMMHVKDGKLHCVATDGHRLSVAKVEMVNATELSNVILPKKAVSELVKLLAIASGNITLNFNQNKFSVKFDTISFTSKLIDGSFPDYTKVIPANNDKAIGVSVSALAHAIDRVSIVNMGLENKGMIFSLSKDNLAIASKSDFGQSSESLDVAYSGEQNYDIRYNYRYILDILHNIDSEKCVFKIQTAETPVLITPEGKDADSLFFVVMPMKI